MATRLLLQLDGSIAIDGMPKLDVTQREIEVANIQGLEYWPGLFSWDLNDANNGFLDRVTDQAAPIWAAGDIRGKFTNFADGYVAYELNSVNSALIKQPFPATGSFTVAAVVGPELSMGSITDGAGYWYLSSSGGKLRYNLGGVGTVYEDYTGPALNNTKMTYVVFIFDRANGELRLRVNGALVNSTKATSLTTANVKSELAFGRTNVNGTVQSRLGHYRVAIGFSRALTGANLASLEAMLAESVY